MSQITVIPTFDESLKWAQESSEPDKNHDDISTKIILIVIGIIIAVILILIFLYFVFQETNEKTALDSITDESNHEVPDPILEDGIGEDGDICALDD